MSLIEACSGALMKVTDAMTESHTFPVNLMGPIIFEVGDWTLDQVDAVLSDLGERSPIVLTTHKTRQRHIQTAFELGRDVGVNKGPGEALAPVRNLRSV